MTTPDASQSDGNDRSPGREQWADDGSAVVFEFAVPIEDFVLENVFREFPDVFVELERFVPTNHTFCPFLWTSNGETSEFARAVAKSPEVTRAQKVSAFDDGALYQVEWRSNDGSLLNWCENSDNDVALLEAEGQYDEWILKLRFPSRERLAAFRSSCDERDVDVRVVRLYDLTDPKMGEYNVTEKQREALVRALDMGHFEIPREATLDEVADSLGISTKSASERLRRGYTNLISNSLAIGYPTGVGLDDQ